MVSRHISEESARKLLRLEASQEQGRDVVRHLLTGCPDCLAMVYRITTEMGLWPEGGPLFWENAYEKIFDRALAFANEEELRLALENLRGWAKWAGLEPMTPRRRLLTVESNPSYHTWGVYERLLEAGRGYLRSEPADAADVIHLAIKVAETLGPLEVGEKLAADLLAAGWADLGNAKRLAADFGGSRRAFSEARRLLQEGTGDPAQEANLISLEASFVNDLGEIEIAEASLAKAMEIYKSLGDPHLQGRIFLQMGDAIGHVNPQRGLAHLRKALVLIDPTREARLLLCAKHDLAWYLNDLGQPKDARAEELIGQCQPILASWGLHRYALAAWLMLQQAIAERQAGAIFGQIREYYRRYWVRPAPFGGLGESLH